MKRRTFTDDERLKILRGDTQLATSCQFIETGSRKDNKINENSKMNQFLVGCAKFFDVLPKEDLVYDFDHEFIPTEKYDTTYSYKNEKGYFPAVVSVFGYPFYLADF